MLLKTKAFFGAGKIILAISIVLVYMLMVLGKNSITPETIQFSKRKMQNTTRGTR
jgi:hypothetical protein